MPLLACIISLLAATSNEPPHIFCARIYNCWSAYYLLRAAASYFWGALVTAGPCVIFFLRELTLDGSLILAGSHIIGALIIFRLFVFPKMVIIPTGLLVQLVAQLLHLAHLLVLGARSLLLSCSVLLAHLSFLARVDCWPNGPRIMSICLVLRATPTAKLFYQWQPLHRIVF